MDITLAASDALVVLSRCLSYRVVRLREKQNRISSDIEISIRAL
jgi:hypothetical protein